MAAVEEVYAQIGEIARQHGVRRVTLFGSRARGTAAPRSDIDIAVEGCDDMAAFEEDIDERLWSLLSVDVVDLDSGVSQALAHAIQNEGKVLYEAV